MDGWMGPCSSWWVTMTTEASRVFGLMPTNAPALVSGSLPGIPMSNLLGRNTS